jgi:tetratricopeptide (TPR) repeat protein
MVLAAMLSDPAAAQEDVVHRRSGIVMRGRIISQDATGVRLQFGASKEPRFIPADEIERIEVRLTAEQQEGERLYAEKNFRGAVEKLSQALEQESRPWLLARIESNIIGAQLALGDSVAAIDAFLAAVARPGSQLSLGAAPLWWLPEPPQGKIQDRAVQLMESNNPLHAVLGASYLYGTDRAQTAQELLAKLVTFRDERIGQLARTQLWRWELPSASAEEVASWQRQLTRLPPEARSGAYFVIGLALERQQQHEPAALAFLWPALVYRGDSRLSSRAQLLAAQSLEQAGQSADAKKLYEELLARFSNSPEAQTARDRLNLIKE